MEMAHAQIYLNITMPIERRQISKLWLEDNGYLLDVHKSMGYAPDRDIITPYMR
jgi:hypothetical protein